MQDNSKKYQKAFYKTIFGTIKEVQILSIKKIIHLDFNYYSYEYVIKFKSGRLKVVNEEKIFFHN